MTYCVAAAVDEGIVFLSDSRTNAGIDQVSEYPKCFRFVWPDERAIVLLSAGSLATTQLVIKQIEKDLKLTTAEDGGPAPINLRTMTAMSDIAAYIGRTSAEAQKVQRRTAPNVQLGSSFIVGGQLPDEEPELYLVYPEGNFIEVSPNQGFLQIGETKYGKPILDRILNNATTLDDAARCCIVSMASTLRSNASVGFPLDLVVYKTNSYRLDQQVNFPQGDRMFMKLSEAWSRGLLQAFEMLPRFDWESQQHRFNIGDENQSQGGSNGQQAAAIIGNPAGLPTGTQYQSVQPGTVSSQGPSVATDKDVPAAADNTGPEVIVSTEVFPRQVS